MKWFLRILGALTVAALFIFTAVQLRRTPNPATHGKLVSVWCAQLLSNDFGKRTEAESILVALGTPAVPQLQLMIRQRDTGVKALARRVLERIDYLGYTVPNPAHSRERAAEVLATLGAKASEASMDLVNALEEKASRESILRALRAMGQQAEPALRQGLSADEASIRINAAFLLGELGAVSPDTEVLLIAGLADHEKAVRQQTASALGKLKVILAENELRRVLQSDPEDEVRLKAAEALGKFEKVSQESQQVLLAKMRRDIRTSVRLACAESLLYFGTPPAEIIPSLIALLESKEGWRATYLLGWLGSRAAPALPELIKMLQREQVPRPFRSPPSSAFAIGRIGPAALPLLEPLLAGDNTRVKLFAVMAIGNMGESGRPGEELLLPALKDPSADVRHAAAMALFSLGVRGETVVQGLAQCLSAEDIYVRSAAADRLRGLAPEREWVVLSE